MSQDPSLDRFIADFFAGGGPPGAAGAPGAGPAPSAATPHPPAAGYSAYNAPPPHSGELAPPGDYGGSAAAFAPGASAGGYSGYGVPSYGCVPC